MAVAGDAVVTGVVSNIARPGGNITGSTFFNPELGAKRLELLKEAFPRSRRVGALVNPDNPMVWPIIREMEAPAGTLNIDLQIFEARRPAEFENAFVAMMERRVDAVTVIEDPMFIANARALGEIASRQRLPLIGFREIVEAGGVVAYGVRWHEMYRRAAVFVDKIFKGAKPGDLPIEQATRFDLLINLRAAKALVVDIPPMLLARADEVIE
jgi:putative ABC transport system substrate-binding protein